MSSDNDTNPFATASIARTALDNLTTNWDGFTITLSGRTPEEGFCVGGVFGEPLVLDSGTDAVSARRRIRLWLSWNESILRQDGVHLGGWLDRETGLFWLDFVKVFSPEERDAALQAAREAREIAVWSLHDGEEIRL